MESYLGEIRMAGFNYAPVGWLFCDGQLLNISEYEELFNVLGTSFGGDGASTFGLPDLRGRAPIHQGNGYTVGQAAGSESVILAPNEIGPHTHSLTATSMPANTKDPTNAVHATTTMNIYIPPQSQVNTASITTTDPADGNNPHYNIQPYICVNFIISSNGRYPPGPGESAED